MPLILIISGLLYALAVFRLMNGLERARLVFETARSAGAGGALPELGIVIAARNEADSLPALLAALEAQDYPAGRLTIVLVDDGSSDGTSDTADRLAPTRHGFRCLRVDLDPEQGSPKKAALAAGIDAVQAPFVLLTDADTVPPPGWARGMAAALAGGCPVVAGYSPGAPRRGLVGWIAGAWDLGTAILAGGFVGSGQVVHLTGRNWGFARSLYAAAGGYDGLERALSGDDTLLAQKFARHAPPRFWGFTLAPELQVPTRPPAGMKQFLSGQLRHVATGIRFTPRALSLAAGAFVLFSLLWLALVTLPWSPWGAAGGIAVGLKLVTDTVAFAVGSAAAGQRPAPISSPVFSLLHLLCFPLLQLAGILLPFNWKGRRSR